jgi:hypothetical protein
MAITLFMVTVKPTNAQSSPVAISVPEFSVKFVDNSYTTPVNITYTTDPYTGEQIKHVSGGEYVKDKYIQITIKNQPFTAYNDTDNHRIDIYYNISYSGHFDGNLNFEFAKRNADSDYTIITQRTELFSPDSKIDYRIQAVKGYETFTTVETYITGPHVVYISTFHPIESSGFSNTQTFELKSQYLAPPTPTPPGFLSEFTPEQFAIIGLSVAVAVLFVIVAVLLKKRNGKIVNQKTNSN